MNTLIQGVKRFWNDEEGMAAVEYVLIVAIMAVAIVAGWGTLATAIEAAFTTTAGMLAS